MPQTESTCLHVSTKQELYRLRDRDESYNDAVQELLSLRMAVEQHPDLSVESLLQDERETESSQIA
jgi:hypothetical protein